MQSTFENIFSCSYGTAVNRRKYSRKYFALVAYVPKNFYALNYPVITEKMRPNAYNQIHQLSNEYLHIIIYFIMSCK